MVQMNWFAGQGWRQRLENKCIDTMGEKGGWGVGGGGMNWEIRIDMYTLICMKWKSSD